MILFVNKAYINEMESSSNSTLKAITGSKTYNRFIGCNRVPVFEKRVVNKKY